MIAVILTLLMASMQPANQADNPVVNVVNALSESINSSLGGWEFRIETGTREGEEDKRPWEPVRLRHNTTEYRFSYRTTVRIPEVFAGTKINGGKAELELVMRGPVDFAAKIFVNDELKAEWPFINPDTGDVEMPPVRLTDNAQPGQTFDIRVWVHNPRVYPVVEFLDTTKIFTFRTAHLILEPAWNFRDELERFRINVEAADTLLRPVNVSEAAKKRRWPEFIDNSKIDPKERRQLRRLLRETVSSFDLEALKAGETEKIQASINETLGKLKPVSEFAKTFTIYCVGNAHIDLAWLWRKQESVRIAANTYSSVLKNMEEFPGLIYAQSQAQTYDWIEKTEPELFEKIKETIDTGNWDAVGGMWVEPDCNIPGGEAWVRQLMYAQKFYAVHFGGIATLGWNPDSFGYNWNMPQFYSKAGIDSFVTQKLSWNDTTIFPYHLFWWEAPDGSRILAYLPTGGYTEQIIPSRMMDQLMRFEQNTGFREMLVLFGLGDHGGGPNRPMLMRVQMLSEQPLFPRVEYIRAHDYIKLLKQKDLSNLPVWHGELYMEGHRGTLTTQSETKRGNRKGEALLEATEKAASIATLQGADYPADSLEKAWKIVLFNQFHDILPGSSITPVYRDAEEDYELCQKLAGRALDAALDQIAARVKTENKGWSSVLVFNPLSWERDDVVKLVLPQDAPETLAVTDFSGNSVPSQVVGSADSLDRKLIFIAAGVPSLGYKTYSLFEGEIEATPPFLNAEGNILENDYLRVEVNPETGNISSIFDKKGNAELLAGGREGNRIELFENMPASWDAWNIGYTSRSWIPEKPDSVELIENGPVRAVIRVKKSHFGLSKANRAPTSGFPSSFFAQDIILYAGSPRVDFVLHTDWWEDHVLMKIAFPFAVDSPLATYEIPFASIERPTVRDEPWQKARFEVSVHRWADLSDDNHGVSLLNDGKYGMDTLGGVMRLTIHTSPIWPDPLADRGKHVCSYAVYPHAGDWRDGGTVRLGQEFNLPLLVRLFTPGSDGELPESASFAKTGAANVDLTCLKRADDGKGYIFRFVETTGKETEVTATLPAAIVSAEEVNLLESGIAEARFDYEKLLFTIKPHEVKSFRIEMQ